MPKEIVKQINGIGFFIGLIYFTSIFAFFVSFSYDSHFYLTYLISVLIFCELITGLIGSYVIIWKYIDYCSLSKEEMNNKVQN